MPTLTTLTGGIVVAGWATLLASDLGALPTISTRAYVTAVAALAATTLGSWHYRARRGEWSRRAFRAGMQAERTRTRIRRIVEQRHVAGLTADTTG